MDTLDEALTKARHAFDVATDALATAEAAARASGLERPPSVIDRLSVKQLRVVDDDGTVRLLIGSHDTMSTLPIRGRVLPHPNRTGAGMLFVNDDGTECGGLIVAGRDGRQDLHLSLDSFEQDQAVVLTHEDQDGARTSVLEFTDRPRWSLAEMLLDLEAAVGDGERRGIQERAAGQGVARPRMRLATEADGSVGLTLRDGDGRERLVLQVTAAGDVAVDVLDDDGVARSLLPSR